MRRFPVLLAACLFTVPAFGAEPKPVPNDDQDMVFLQAARPYRLRLHQQIDGLSFQHQWNDIFQKLFAFLDQDGNGVLSPKELEHAPSPNQLRAMIQGASELEADEPPKLKVAKLPWRRFDLDPAQRAGLLTQASVLTVHAHWDKSSLVHR
ncbi:MAG: hypothetical protein ACJ8F7_02885, partial [Gemmataceae bacterium]